MRPRCSFGTTLSSWSSLERRWNSMRLAGQHWYLKLHFTIKTTDLTFLKCLLFAFMGIKCLLFRNEIFKKAHHLNFEKFKFLAIAALVLLRFQIHQIRNFQFESNQIPKNHLLNVTTVNSKKKSFVFDCKTVVLGSLTRWVHAESVQVGQLDERYKQRTTMCALERHITLT